MQKNLFRDMVKINQAKRSLRPKIVVEPDLESRQFITVKKSRNTLWLVALIAIVFFLCALSYLFSRATIIVDPKIKDTTLNQNLSASLNSDTNTEILSFDMITITGEESATVTATEKKEVSQNARGVVILYNKFSSLPQRLDINTRLEGSNGKIYKTEKALTVPGMTGTTPGYVEVAVYGAESGESYNSEPLDFKIFGFRGTPKYEKFYGRSKGNLNGGFTGSSFVILPEDKTKTLENLKIALQAKLFKNATGQIPSGFILFPNASSLELEDNRNDSFVSASNSFSLTLKGTFYGILLKEIELTKKIAEKVIDGYDEQDVYIANIKDLIFSLTNNTTPLKDLKNIDFNLSGQAKIVWRLDTDKLKFELVGKKKSDFNQILFQYSNITSANLSLSPVWNRTIPDKLKDIKIIVNYPN